MPSDAARCSVETERTKDTTTTNTTTPSDAAPFGLIQEVYAARKAVEAAENDLRCFEADLNLAAHLGFDLDDEADQRAFYLGRLSGARERLARLQAQMPPR